VNLAGLWVSIGVSFSQRYILQRENDFKVIPFLEKCQRKIICYAKNKRDKKNMFLRKIFVFINRVAQS